MADGKFDSKLRISFVAFAFILFSIITISIFTFLIDRSMAAGFTLSYIAGLSTIFLPCTLPLIPIALPIAASESPRKGLGAALLFVAGMVITLSIYGVVFAYGGEIAFLPTMVVISGIVGGGLTYVFGLSGLGLIKMTLHRKSIPPVSIQKRGDYLKFLILGLLLANVGMDCPNPIFYVILEHIRNAGVFTGWSVMAIYGAGKATPLLFLIILGILGINATGITKRIAAKKARDWGLIFAGVILFTTMGLFLEWYEEITIHDAWNNMLLTLSDGWIGEVETVSMEKNVMLEALPQWLGPYVLVLLLTLPVVLNFYKKRKERRS